MATDPDGWQLVSFTGISLDGTHELYVTRRAPGASSFAPPVAVAPFTSPRRYDDKAMLAADVSAASPFRGRVYATWDRGNRNGQMVLLSHSDDHGATWTYGGRLFKGKDGYGPYVKYAYDGDGTIHFVATEDHPRNFDNSLYHGIVRDGQICDSAGSVLALLAAHRSARANPELAPNASVR